MSSFPDMMVLTENNVQLVNKNKSVSIENYSGKNAALWPLFEDVLEKHKPESSISSKTVTIEFDSDRWRCSVFQDYRGWSASLRKLLRKPPTFSDLVIDKNEVMSLMKPGLVLISGPNASGKSTTLYAAMNALKPEERGVTVTIENPIEAIYMDKSIHQREIGTHVSTYASGVRDALKANVKTIIIQEIHDSETAIEAIRAGASGHLVIATLHAKTPSDAIIRLTSLVPSDMASIIPHAVSGIFSQLLIQAKGGETFVVYESVLFDESVKSIICAGLSNLIRLPAEIARQKRKTFWSCAEKLIQDGIVDRDVANTVLPKDNRM